MIFKLAETAERSWQNQLPKIIVNIKFTDGLEVVRSQAQPLPPAPFRHQDSAIAPGVPMTVALSPGRPTAADEC
jgi:hypothetical protein